jgi:prepilin-type processing-associated H-X9-DG protein
LVTDANDPRVIFAADRGLPAAYTNGVTIRHLPALNSPRWLGAHGEDGNILFSDGHVDLSHNSDVLSEEAIAEDVAYPSVKGAPLVAQTGGGNGGDGGAGGSGVGGGTAPIGGGTGKTLASTNLTGNSGGTNSRAPVPGGTAAGGSALLAPTQSAANLSHVAHSSNRQIVAVTAPAQGQMDVSNPVPDAATATTNSPGGPASRQGINDAMMSPFDREVAGFLRDLILGTYLLILLLLLLFVAYRIWRWTQNPERKRGRSG